MPRGKPLKPPRTNGGAVLLQAVHMSLEGIADAIGCQTLSLVHDWRMGRKKPGPAFRAALAKQFGIPVTAWDTAAAATDTDPLAEYLRGTAGETAERAADAAVELPPADEPDPAAGELGDVLPELGDADAPPPEALGATRQEVDAQLLRARRAAHLRGLTPAAAAKLSAEIRSLLRLRAYLDATEAVTLDRLARSEAFRVFRDQVVAIVRDCPECLEKLIAAMDPELSESLDPSTFIQPAPPV